MYPIKFKPQLKENIWGGQRLLEIKKGLYPRTIDKTKVYGESWDISGVKGSISKVANGFLKGNNLQEIIEVYMGELVGDAVYEKYGLEFPVLLKFIDTREKLSIQVHPSHEFAQEMHSARGKSEMWYIVDAKEGAAIYLDFKYPLSEEEYDKAVEEGVLTAVLGTNLTYRKPELLERSWYFDVDCSKYCAYFVAAINHEMSVGSIIDPIKKIEALLASRK